MRWMRQQRRNDAWAMRCIGSAWYGLYGQPLIACTERTIGLDLLSFRSRSMAGRKARAAPAKEVPPDMARDHCQLTSDRPTIRY